jgi:FKBP-type peptidyl-prolyl cis-trans isomerase (trigger factor)
MATDKQYTVAGVSTSTDGTKIRFANDVMRVKVLAKNGHSNITLVELPNSMLKTEAAKFIAQLDEFQDTEAQIAIAEYLEKHDKQPKARVEVKKAVKAAVQKRTVADTVMAEAKAKVNLEDAPF